MNAQMDILYQENWTDLDMEYNHIRVELRRYQNGSTRCDFILEYAVIVEGETILDVIQTRSTHVNDPAPIRLAIATFDALKLNHFAAMAESEDNNSLGSGQC